MDFQTPLVFVSVFSVASVLLFFIYKFGIKQKSYEEALAEQRQKTQIILGGVKPKPKDKKPKKVSKRSVKEKAPVETEAVEETEVEVHEEPKPHVEFKEAPEEVQRPHEPVAPTVSKKHNKKDKVKPILVNKNKEVVEVTKPSAEVATNHFEESHPKDVLELARGNIEVSVKKEEETVVVSKKSKSEQEPKQTSKQSSPTFNEKRNATPHNSATNGIISGKEKKKKKSEITAMQQLAAGDPTGATMLLNLVRKAELSRSEVQILIDLLLNKQHEAPAVVEDWSEGKFDPVQKLKKQLAEKEYLLEEEQQVSSNALAKLRDIRTEHQAERSQLQQKIRSFEENFQSKQNEIVLVQQQLQQLQTQLQDELFQNQRLRDEHANMQMQKQQFEMRLAQVKETEEINFNLKSELNEAMMVINNLRLELARLGEESMADKEQQQGLLMQLSNFQKELEQINEINRQLQETVIDRERNLKVLLTQENSFKTDLSQINSVLQQKMEEIRRLEHGKKQSIDELQKHKDETNKILGQLQSDLRKVQEEKTNIQNTKISNSLQENKQHEVEIYNLNNDLASLKSQLNESENKYETELKKVTATVAKLEADLEKEKAELEEQKGKNDKLRTRNTKAIEALNIAESRIAKIKSDTECQREFAKRLFPEIKELETIHNDVFHSESEKLIRNFIKSQQEEHQIVGSESAEMQLLQSQLLHYKHAIDSTDKMLIKLQNHIEHEELNWRVQLSKLEKELKEEREDKEKISVVLQNVQTLKAQKLVSSNGLHCDCECHAGNL